MKACAITLTIIAWIIGLFLDANLGTGDLTGFINLRTLLPVLVMGYAVLKAVENNSNDKNKGCNK